MPRLSFGLPRLPCPQMDKTIYVTLTLIGRLPRLPFYSGYATVLVETLLFDSSSINFSQFITCVIEILTVLKIDNNFEKNLNFPDFVRSFRKKIMQIKLNQAILCEK